MKRRICEAITGIGGGRGILTNNGSVNKELGKELIESYFKEWEGFDFQIEDDKVMFGIEPSYMKQKYKVITIHKDKNLSSYSTGYAFGAYGTDILKNTKEYRNYKNKCKFTRFIDKWHEQIF